MDKSLIAKDLVAKGLMSSAPKLDAPEQVSDKEPDGMQDLISAMDAKMPGLASMVREMVERCMSEGSEAK